MNKNIVAIFDIDGVLTDGRFLYDKIGKQYKRFGPDDAYALKLIEDHVQIVFVSSDKRGFRISEARVNDMGFVLNEVSYKNRLNWINEHYPKEDWFQIYMGDSFTDAAIFKSVDVGICPANGHKYAKETAKFVTDSEGGNRAVCDAVFWIIENILKMDVKKMIGI